MSDSSIDPFWEFYYETGIDPTGGELDTGEQEYEEVIEDESGYVEECCCHQVHGLGPEDRFPTISSRLPHPPADLISGNITTLLPMRKHVQPLRQRR